MSTPPPRLLIRNFQPKLFSTSLALIAPPDSRHGVNDFQNLFIFSNEDARHPPLFIEADAFSALEIPQKNALANNKIRRTAAGFLTIKKYITPPENSLKNIYYL